MEPMEIRSNWSSKRSEKIAGEKNAPWWWLVMRDTVSGRHRLKFGWKMHSAIFFGGLELGFISSQAEGGKKIRAFGIGVFGVAKHFSAHSFEKNLFAKDFVFSSL